ncbi:MAG TPA: PEGA domain-containing protein [Micropepsaceae bacterium]|nr:PEGA domain-containing protein [Micropepsaceae bacterium]
MEFIFVKFDPADPRDVVVNGDAVGKTDTTLIVPPSFYVIKLSGDGYLPVNWLGDVVGTTTEHPLHIVFSKVPTA